MSCLLVGELLCQQVCCHARERRDKLVYLEDGIAFLLQFSILSEVVVCHEHGVLNVKEYSNVNYLSYFAVQVFPLYSLALHHPFQHF